MDNRRIPISVSVTPSEYSGRSIRLGGGTDIRDKMNQRMRDFEEESRKWREDFMGGSSLGQKSIFDNRPKMFFNYPEFPELTSSFQSPLGRLGNSSSSFFDRAPLAIAPTSHKSFIEEDDNGSKKYRILFDVGDFKPNELSIKTEGRQLVVKGDRELVAGSATESKQFNREITLPDFVEPTSVTSFLGEGTLTIEAPVILDKLGYSNNNALANATTTSTSSSSSTMRNSPFRDSNSPSRIGFGSSSLLNSRFRNSREDLLRDMNSMSSISSSSLAQQQLQQQKIQQQQELQQQQQQQQQLQQQQQQSIFNAPFFTEVTPSSSTIVSNAQQIVGSNAPVTYKFNMSEFRPEDINLTVTDTTLKVHAVREESDNRGSGKTYRNYLNNEIKSFINIMII